MNIHSKKSHFLMSGNTKEIAYNDHNYIGSDSSQELFGIATDWRFSMKKHINKLWKQPSQKLITRFRVSNYMTFEKNDSFYYITVTLLVPGIH